LLGLIEQYLDSDAMGTAIRNNFAELRKKCAAIAAIVRVWFSI
jgi:hypothetical protein